MKPYTIFLIALSILFEAFSVEAEPTLKVRALDFIERGQSGKMVVNISGASEDYAGMNAEIKFPEGFTVTNIEKGTLLSDDFTISWENFSGTDGNSTTVIAYSTSDVFHATDGDVLILTVNVDNDKRMGKYPINFAEINPPMINSKFALANRTGSASFSPTPANGLISIPCRVNPGIAAGCFHTVVFDSSSKALAWGLNDKGQLGDGTTTNSSEPTAVINLTDVTSVSAGWKHTVALKSDGTVWAWGWNLYGQLGDGTTDESHEPIQVTGLSNVMAITCGYFHTIAIQFDGTIWAWGDNSYGQLGDGTTDNRSEPTPVIGLTGVTAISAGMRHSIALKSDGTVWAWGLNNKGQLGDGTTNNRSEPMQVIGLNGITNIDGGYQFSVARKSDGTVWVWGDNNSGQLGDGTYDEKHEPIQVNNLTGVVKISAGDESSLAVKTDGTIWAWGNLPSETKLVPYQYAVLPDMIGASDGNQFIMTLSSDGSVWTWGNNEYGQLGDGMAVYRAVPLDVASLFKESADLSDAILVLQILAGINSPVFCLTEANNDNKIGIEDAIYIMQKISGLR